MFTYFFPKHISTLLYLGNCGDYMFILFFNSRREHILQFQILLDKHFSFYIKFNTHPSTTLITHMVSKSLLSAWIFPLKLLRYIIIYNCSFFINFCLANVYLNYVTIFWLSILVQFWWWTYFNLRYVHKIDSYSQINKVFLANLARRRTIYILLGIFMHQWWYNWLHERSMLILNYNII